MREPVTVEQLRNYHGSGDFTDKVKETIEKIVAEHDMGPSADYLRGYLVNLCEEVEIDDKLLEELEDDAAAWADGWNYCKAWIRTCDETEFCPEVGENFVCYMVPGSLVAE
jgi:hypothetical protein